MFNLWRHHFDFNTIYRHVYTSYKSLDCHANFIILQEVLKECLFLEVLSLTPPIFASFLYWVWVLSPEANKPLTCSHFNYGCKWKHSTQIGVVNWRKLLGTLYMPSPCFTHICFMSFGFIICALSLMVFGWLFTAMLTPYSWWAHHFLFMPPQFTHSFSGTRLWHETQAWCTALCSTVCQPGMLLLLFQWSKK